MIVLTIIISVIAFILSYVYAKYSTRRIKTLAKQVQRVENGDLNVSCIVDSDDEIGELQNSFNFMVRRISVLIDERYNLGKNLKDMELRALQAQINPHFLYNTLDLISWKATANGDMETVDIVVKLARFYRLSLSNGSDFLPLSDEAEHVRLFVELTNLSHINNELGRVKGNEVLRRFADFIKEASATCGTVYYNGGWQFIGFFEQCRREDAESFADYMHRLVHAYNEESGDAKMEYSLGMAESRTANAHTLRTLLRGAMMDRRKQED